MRPLIIPFFIPHAGCPHTCLFCNQHLISGVQAALPSAEQIATKTYEWLSRSPGRPAEVAFFGGSFTALPRLVQHQLLDAVQPLIDDGKVQGIRLSTRPDAVDDDILSFVARYRVRTIEIGVQSLDDQVLNRSGRGYTARQALDALERTRAVGFHVGAQLLPGLPGDTLATALASLRGVVTAGAQFVRIYPAVVLAGTGLAKLYVHGSYRPPDLEQGVRIAARLLHAAMLADCPVVRIGLQADEGLVPGDTILAGCWHPALGQLVRGELYYDLVRQLAYERGITGPLTVWCHPGRLSDLQGHGRQNLVRWSHDGLTVTVRRDAALSPHEVRLDAQPHIITGSLLTTLHYRENFHA